MEQPRHSQYQVSGIPVLIPAIAVVTLAVIGVSVYTLMKDRGEDPEERLEMLVNQVELELEEGQTVEESHVADEVQMAEDALENDEYDRASEIMEDIEQKIE